MARGWESKSVEEQIDATKAEREARAKPELTDYERKRKTRKDGLLLARTRIIKDLESARNHRYRELLERNLAHIDMELAKFETD
jgi:hypothetical protein